MNNVKDCGSFIDEYTPLLRASLAISEYVFEQKPLYLRQSSEQIVKVSERLMQENPQMVSTDIINMIKDGASNILVMMNLAEKQGLPLNYEILSTEGLHLEMLTLEAMILDTARCVKKER